MTPAAFSSPMARILSIASLLAESIKPQVLMITTSAPSTVGRIS